LKRAMTIDVTLCIEALLIRSTLKMNDPGI